METLLPVIKKESWACSICLEIMDGTEQHNGKTCISKRCMHIFHESCVERAVDAKRSCPLCRTHLDRMSLMHNKDFEEECIEWQKDPCGYTLEAAFFKKYSCSPEQKGIKVEDILRPEALHGQNWNPELTSREKVKFIYECIERGYTKEEFFSTLHSVYDSIDESNQEMRRKHEESQQEFLGSMQGFDEKMSQYRESERLRELRNKSFFSKFYNHYNFPRNPQNYGQIYCADKQVLRALFLISIFAMSGSGSFDKETNAKGIFLSILVNEVGLFCVKRSFGNNLPLANIQNEATQNQKVVLKILKIVSGTLIGSGISYISGSCLPKILISQNSIKKVALVQSSFKLFQFLFSEQPRLERNAE